MNRLLTTLSATDLFAYENAGLWGDATLYALVAARARQTPDKVAFRERHRCVSFSKLLEAADRCAAALADAGLHRGDRVAVWLPSRVEVAIAVLACSRSGFVVCPSLHRDHTVAEVGELIGVMDASALIAESGHGADAQSDEIATIARAEEHIRFVELLDPPDSERRGTFFGGDSTSLENPDPDPNSVVYLAFTSGTTGRPKGVMHSDNTLLTPIRALSQDWSLDHESIVYSMSPLSHNLGFGAMLLALVTGAEFVVHDLPPGASLAARLLETRASFAFGVPTHAYDLLADLESSHQPLPDLRGMRVSGAAVPRKVVEGLLSHKILVQSGYGMTEAGSHHYTLPGDSPEVIATTSGRTCRGYAVRIFDQEDPDHEIPAGKIGQIGGRGASLMLGYFGDQESTESSFNSSGWFITGDLGWIDEKRYLHVTGRKKEVIIRGGHNIFPVKLESLTVQFPGIRRAAAIPIADERLGERVCLVVEPPGVATSSEVLAHLAASGMSKYDLPEYFVESASIPLLPSGKVFKRGLVEQIERDELTPTFLREPPPSVPEPDRR